jgi:hypothetical protein
MYRFGYGRHRWSILLVQFICPHDGVTGSVAVLVAEKTIFEELRGGALYLWLPNQPKRLNTTKRGPSKMSATRLLPLPKAPRRLVARADHNPMTSTRPSRGLSERSPRPSETKGNGAQEQTAEAMAITAAIQPIPKSAMLHVRFRVPLLIVFVAIIAPRRLPIVSHT